MALNKMFGSGLWGGASPGDVRRAIAQERQASIDKGTYGAGIDPLVGKAMRAYRGAGLALEDAFQGVAGGMFGGKYQDERLAKAMKKEKDRKFILSQLDTDGDGKLSAEEKQKGSALLWSLGYPAEAMEFEKLAQAQIDRDRSSEKYGYEKEIRKTPEEIRAERAEAVKRKAAELDKIRAQADEARGKAKYYKEGGRNTKPPAFKALTTKERGDLRSFISSSESYRKWIRDKYEDWELGPIGFEDETFDIIADRIAELRTKDRTLSIKGALDILMREDMGPRTPNPKGGRTEAERRAAAAANSAAKNQRTKRVDPKQNLIIDAGP